MVNINYIAQHIKKSSTSKGGLIQYSCPECESTDIYRAKMYGQNSVVCNDCGSWSPWRDRLKKRI